MQTGELCKCITSDLDWTQHVYIQSIMYCGVSGFYVVPQHFRHYKRRPVQLTISLAFLTSKNIFYKQLDTSPLWTVTEGVFGTMN